MSLGGVVGAKGGTDPQSALLHHMINTPRCTMSITRTKGLLNMPGQNNCFLNSAVQVLWHLDVFRRSFRDLSGHVCMADACIFCALKELFQQFQFSHDPVLHSNALRRALAETFFDQRRFQLGFMDDAAECFENMLLRIHYHSASHEAEDMCSVPHCIPHQKFAMTLVEQTVCHVCGATSEPLPFTQMVHYVSASAICWQASQHKNDALNFGKLLHLAGGMGDIRDCPSSCGAKIQIRRTLMNRPDIVSLGLVWDSDRPSSEHVVNLLDTLGTSINLQEVFHSVKDNTESQNVTHQLVGLVTYYGKHYSTFFFHTKLRVWIYFDDAAVRQIGPNWSQVVEKCRRGHFQPLLLLYANPDGTAIDASNAPTTTIHCNGNSLRNYNELSRVVKTGGDIQLPARPLVGGASPQYANLQDLQAQLHRHRANSETLCAKYLLEGVKVYNQRLTPEDIYRQKVEQVLARERQHRQRLFSGPPHTGMNLPQSVGCRTSSSSLESFENAYRERLVEQLEAGRRRDSGNWSGDRNSASSSSSASVDNAFYVPGIPPKKSHYLPSVNSSSQDCTNTTSITDNGYDSYSLSSNESNEKANKISSLKDIPEESAINDLIRVVPSKESIDRALRDPQIRHILTDKDRSSHKKLWDHADWLLKQSVQLEQAGDLEVAVFLSDAAASKARSAFEAPHHDSRTLSAAKKQHNDCVIRSTQLHKKLNDLAQAKRIVQLGLKEQSQQSQDSNVEIYATLPKRKKGLLAQMSTKVKESEIYNDLLKKSKQQIKTDDELTDYHSDWEPDTNKRSGLQRTNSNPSGMIKACDTESIKEKKQHRIRRKLMGGFLRRKNRSLPDLREGMDDNCTTAPSQTFEDDTSSSTKQLSPVRGFRQPHRAFVPRSTQKPLLTKVAPPTIALNDSRQTKSYEDLINDGIASLPELPPPAEDLLRPPSVSTTQSSDIAPAVSSAFLKELRAKRDQIIRSQLHHTSSAEEFQDACHNGTGYSSDASQNKSVRDLASAFENMTTVACDDTRKSSPPRPPTPNTRFVYEEPGKCTDQDVVDAPASPNQVGLPCVMQNSSSSLSYDLSRNKPGNMVPPPPRLASNSRSVSPAISEGRRPNRPPDYETALQRRQLLNRRTSPAERCSSVTSEKMSMDTSCASLPPPPEIVSSLHLRSSSLSSELGIVKPAPEIPPKVTTSPKKSVTFSDEVVLVACAEEQVDDYVPNPLLERIYFQAQKQRNDTPSVSSESANSSSDSLLENPNAGSTIACNLCHKKRVDPNAVYCSDCAFYMSRFQQRS